MVAVTSGLTEFVLDVDDIIEEAVEPLGGEYTTGPEMTKARRTLNLVLIQLQNKNIPLNKIESLSVPILAGTLQYTLNNSVSDVLELNMQSSSDNLEIPTERWGLRDYHEIPNKTVTGRPTLWTTDRQENNVILKLWPTPDTTYTAKLLVASRIEDVTASYQRIDLPYRYYPLVVKWLRYELSLSREELPLEKIVIFKNDLESVMPDSFDEDRERVDMTIKPGGISGK